MTTSTNISSILIITILILINLISSYHFFRIDLTDERKYSISEETKAVLRNLDDIIYFKVYLHGDIPVEYKKLEHETKYMLNEFRAYSKYIEYDFIDPSSLENENYKTSLQEELYRKGISPIPHRNYQNTKMEEFFLFPGILASYKSKEHTISLINETLMHNADEVIKKSIEDLEYFLINSIRNLTTQKKQTIALINGHGETTDHAIYSFKDLISEHYNLVNIEIQEKIAALDNIDCIIINNPQTFFTEKDKFIIDQFIMNGGKSIWILNGHNANMDSLETQNETIVLPSKNLNLDDLLFKYGLRINSDLVQDLQSSPIPIVTHYIDTEPQWSLFPWVFFPVIIPNEQNILTYNINPVKTTFPSSIDTIKNQTKKTIILKTSEYTKVSTIPALINLENLKQKPNENTFRQGGKNVAVLLSGTFESVFRNRLNPNISTHPSIKFKESIIDNKMIVISDKYFINNQFFQGSPLPLGFDKHTGNQYGNNDFMLNSIDFLLGNQEFIKIRSKNIATRLLDSTKVNHEKEYWQIINILIPLIILSLLGGLLFMIRKKKYNI